MNFEKIIDAAIGLDLQDEALNFLDIKISAFNQKLKAVFEEISNIYIIKETYIFDHLMKSFENIKSKVVFSKTIEVLKSGELFEKTANLDLSDKFKAFEKDNILESKLLNVFNDKTKHFNESVFVSNAKDEKIQDLFLVSKLSENIQNSINIKIVPYFKDLKLVSLSFNKMLSFNEKKICNSFFLNNPEKKAVENSIKLNLKLFNDAFSQALKGSFEIFHARQIVQPPFGIVAFYIKEKDKKHIPKKNKKRKRYSIPNLQLKEEKPNKNFK